MLPLKPLSDKGFDKFEEHETVFNKIQFLVQEKSFLFSEMQDCPAFQHFSTNC